MIECSQFIDELTKHGVSFFAGVPDSLLKELCACIEEEVPTDRHVITCNEGAAVALAIGHHLATGRVPAVYLQNSGLGNLINPIASLADPQVFGIPILLMIGWRGEVDEEGVQSHDEPQHIKQGQITLDQLRVLDIPYEIIDISTEDCKEPVAQIIDLARSRSGPTALVFRKNTFKKYDRRPVVPDSDLIGREDALSICLQHIPSNSVVVSTTGMASRELFEIRAQRGETHCRDFLTVGGMGHASHIALGIALEKPKIPVICIDGDGALLMHMGALPFCARASNFIHLVINNGAHDSVGGQKTLAKELDLSLIAQVCGYTNVRRIVDVNTLRAEIQTLEEGMSGSTFIEILCRPGNRSDLGRPTISPKENKETLMGFLRP